MDSMESSFIRVILADDHPLARQGVRAMLEKTSDIQVVGEAGDGTEAMALVSQLRPDVVLLDIEMPGPRASEVEAWLRQHYPQTIGLVLSAHDRDAYLAEMFDAGASGYLDKHLPVPQLVQAIRRAVQGENLFNAEQLSRMRRWRAEVQARWEDLTAREQEILKLLAQGQRTDDIAGRLAISSHTVDTHIRNLLPKLQVESRAEAIAWAWNYGIVERPG